jgi:hypothetical protein
MTPTVTPTETLGGSPTPTPTETTTPTPTSICEIYILTESNDNITSENSNLIITEQNVCT